MPELMTKQDAIEYLLYMKHDVQAKSPMDIALDTAIEALKQPTIEPEVRHGRWLSYTGTHYTGKENEYGDPEYKEHIFFVCSNCRRKTVVREHFCPRCGAGMREASEDVGTD